MMSAIFAYLLLNMSFAYATDIVRGQSGNDVVVLQEMLVNQGYLIDKVDGIFGNNTEYAVKGFQKAQKLPITGKVDEKTLSAIKQNEKNFTKKRVIKEGKSLKVVTDRSNNVSRNLLEGRSRIIEQEVNQNTDVYKYGDRGNHIKKLQEKLSINGFSTNGVDGIFGQGTVSAVKNFQLSHKIKSTGVIDKITRQLIEESPGRPTKYKNVLEVEASAYSAYDPGNGSYTANGNKLRRGLIAVDPAVIPLGTEVFVEGYGYAVADDVGGAINGHKIDVAMESREEAIQFGRKKVNIYILK